MFPEQYTSPSGRASHDPAGASSSYVPHASEYIPGTGTRRASTIGTPIIFSTGQFAGLTVRMELQEIQAPQLGRKYARVDRRPLDPPPVALLKVFAVQNAGTNREIESEMNYDEIETLGLLCTVDLFPVPDSFVDSFSSAKPSSRHVNHSSPSPASSSAQSPRNHYHHSLDGSTSLLIGPNESHVRGTGMSTETRIPDNSSQFCSYILPSQAGDDVVHQIDEYSITEGSKQTQALAGASFVQGVKVDYQGKKAVLFVFSDLAVKIEGTFVLRYRVFDLFSSQTTQNGDAMITAETYGGTFRVYSTKEFPGLPPSTELTKHLARWGIRLNIRETERRRRKRSKSHSPSPS